MLNENQILPGPKHREKTAFSFDALNQRKGERKKDLGVCIE